MREATCGFRSGTMVPGEDTMHLEGIKTQLRDYAFVCYLWFVEARAAIAALPLWKRLRRTRPRTHVC
jgi:hypothetical protein